MKTRAAVVEGERSAAFQIMELDVDPPGADEIHVRFVAAGLCHSDHHLIDGIFNPRFPIVGGHEGAGIVESVGPGVTKFQPGDHIVCSFMPNCGKCRYCLTGRSTLCNLGKHLMVGEFPDGTFRYHNGGRDYGSICMLGTFSERATISQYSAVKIDDWLPLTTAVLVGCGVPTGWGTAVNAGGVQAGDTVIVYGIGGIGINAVQGAAQAGAKYVVAVDPVAFKRDTALEFGATHAFSSAEEAAEKVDQLTWGEGADQALVTVGIVGEKVVRDAFDAVGKGGTVVITGQAHPEALTVQLPSALLTRSEKVIRGSQFGSCNPHYDIPRLLRMYDAGKLRLDELITKRYTLDEINDGYRDLLAGEIIRGVIVYD